MFAWPSYQIFVINIDSPTFVLSRKFPDLDSELGWKVTEAGEGRESGNIYG